MVWMRDGDGVVMPKLKSVKRGLSDHLSGGTAAMRGALWTAAIYVSLSVWHYLFFHQFLLFALLFAAFELAPTYAHVLAFLTVGNHHAFHYLFRNFVLPHNWNVKNSPNPDQFLAAKPGYLYFYFDGSERSGKRRWEWFLTSWITDALTDYFPMKLIRTKGRHGYIPLIPGMLAHIPRMLPRAAAGPVHLRGTPARCDAVLGVPHRQDLAVAQALPRHSRAEYCLPCVLVHPTTSPNGLLFPQLSRPRACSRCPSPANWPCGPEASTPRAPTPSAAATNHYARASLGLTICVWCVWCVCGFRRALENLFSLLILPGGSLEILEAHPHVDEQVLVLERRKGFIELALKYGIPLVPVYSFGATELYDQVRPREQRTHAHYHRTRTQPHDTHAYGS